MRNNEKFMFDTIFDELEPILPELAESENSMPLANEEKLEIESDEVPVTIYNDTDISVARQEGFDDGKKEGANEALTGIEKTLADTLTAITNDLSVFLSEQNQANIEVSRDAVTLALTIVRKFFPTLNDKTALDEINSVLVVALKRLIGEPEIIIKVNPTISDDLSDKLKHQFPETHPATNVSIVADKGIDKGNCEIEWSNGKMERNINTLMQEIEDIIAQNSTKEISAVAVTEEKTEAESNNNIR